MKNGFYIGIIGEMGPPDAVIQRWMADLEVDLIQRRKRPAQLL